jgi:hypothetical protein
MFDYLEKRSEKRIFFSYLHQFELTQENLGNRITRQILSVIHEHASKTADKFHEPLSTVSGNIISAAAWGTIYCFLGSDRMLSMQPGFRDIVNEVEWELMAACDSLNSERSIYCEIFSILYAKGLCHPEVTLLLNACLQQSSDLRMVGETGY